MRVYHFGFFNLEYRLTFGEIEAHELKFTNETSGAKRHVVPLERKLGM